ncbi:MAG: tetratricopeptide repeat protein [Candidatus Freyarchaeota archaeon]
MNSRARELVNKGNEFFNLGKFKEAIHFYDEALALSPECSEALFNKGVALLELHRFREALNYFNRVLEMNPRDWEALTNKGNVLYNLLEFREALECYNKALEVNPKDAETLYNRGNLLLRLGKFEEAAQMFDEALSLNPRIAEASLNKALALLVFTKPSHCEEAISRVGAVIDSLECAWSQEKLSPQMLERFRTDVPRLMIQVIQNLAQVCGSQGSKTVRRIKELLTKILGDKGYREFVEKTNLEIHPGSTMYRDILK